MMRQADVDAVVASARARGRSIDDYHAAVFVGAREILAKEPDNKAAAEVVSNFTKFLATGIETPSFAQFALPLPETEEELAAQRDRAAAYAATLGKQA